MPEFELSGISGALSNERNLITNPCELNKFSHQISQSEFQTLRHRKLIRFKELDFGTVINDGTKRASFVFYIPSTD